MRRRVDSDYSSRIFLIATAVVFLTAIIQTITPEFADAGTAAKSPKAQETSKTDPSYVIGPEDVLEISVWKNSDLSKIVTVRPDGIISLPLIGDFQAAGLTPSQLRESIASKLAQYQKTVVVSVIVQDINSYKIYIVGEVNAPGMYQLKSNTSIVQAIALANGFTQFASKNKVLVIRKDNNGGGEERIKVRFSDLLDDKYPGSTLILRPGDTIFVP